MKIKDFRCKCGRDDFFFADKGNQIGIYCSYCGKWIKWADKDEQNLRMKQVSVIDKIKAEIEQLPTTTKTNWNGCCPDIDYPEIEYIDVTKNKLLSILDKYTEESEG